MSKCKIVNEGIRQWSPFTQCITLSITSPLFLSRRSSSQLFAAYSALSEKCTAEHLTSPFSTLPTTSPLFRFRRSSSQLFAAYSALSEEGTAAMVEDTLSQVADVSLPGECKQWATVATLQRTAAIA